MEHVDIRKLIPQRDPILMVDSLVDVKENTAVTALTITADNYFIDGDGKLAEAGLIEHIAQSASALAGYRIVAAGATEPPLGYIGEVKKFHCYRRPQTGEVLRTTVTMGVKVAGVTAITGETYVADQLVADTQMKIFMK